MPCLGLAILSVSSPADAQSLAPELFRPVRDGFFTPQASGLRRTAAAVLDDRAPPDASDPSRNAQAGATDPNAGDTKAPSRIGQIPTYGLPAASGAATSGYDALNRTRRKPTFYPGQARPKPSPGPGSPPPASSQLTGGEKIRL